MLFHLQIVLSKSTKILFKTKLSYKKKNQPNKQTKTKQKEKTLFLWEDV